MKLHHFSVMGVLEKRKDPIGAAIADFYKNGVAGRLRVMSSMFDEDEIPVEHLFREFEEMSEIEQVALELSRGRCLDVGAGAGCHSLVLQDRGVDVCAIDISPLSVETMKNQGVADVRLADFFADDLREQFDTILMLMNGSGIIGKIDNMPKFFARLKILLAKGGQVLLDSSDLIYLFEDEEGSADIDLAGDYYGEVDYAMQYKNIKGDSFDWLYVDFETLAYHAEACGFVAELIKKGEHYDYLARLSCKNL